MSERKVMPQETIEKGKRFVYKFIIEDNMPQVKRFLDKGFPPDTPVNELN